jgi:predicted RNase H-like HicB family nuclease
MEFIYPAKFEQANEGGLTVTFPDFRGAVTAARVHLKVVNT